MSDYLSAILDADAVSLDIVSKKKPEIIRELVELLGATGAVSDVEGVVAEVTAREAMASTGVGNGVAIPHCLSASVRGTAMAFGRRASGAKFDAVDRRPVQLFFLMVGLPGAHNVHLRLLSKLSRYLGDSEFKSGLLGARSGVEVVGLFARREGV